MLCEIRYTYINDLSINMTDHQIEMGEPGTSWYYVVPFKGQMLPAGRDKEGNPAFRPATARDARSGGASLPSRSAARACSIVRRHSATISARG